MHLDGVLDRVDRDHVAILHKGDGATDLSLWDNMPNTETMRPVKEGLTRLLFEDSHAPSAESSISETGDIKSQASAHD